MALFKTTKAQTASKTPKTFGDQLNDIQSIFQTAKTKAQALAASMTAAKTAKEAQIVKLNEEIASINEVETRNNSFIQTLEQFTK